MQEDHPKKQPSVPEFNVRKRSTNSQCDICFEQYQLMGKWPILACPNQHFFCDHCIQGLLALNMPEPAPCPICRTLIRKALLKPHRQLLHSLIDANIVENAAKEHSSPLFAFAFQYEVLEVAALFKEGKGEQVESVQRLELEHRGIPDVQLLTLLPNLNSLHLQNNLLASVLPLQHLKALKILNLSGNQLVQIDCLSSLARLENLAAEFNQIKRVNLVGFSKLKHFFLFGNPLDNCIVDELLMIEFPRLATLSFSIESETKAPLTHNFLESLPTSQTLPSLSRLIVEQLFDEEERSLLELSAHTGHGAVALEWLQTTGSVTHQQWLQEFFHERHHYGQAFRFIVDPASPNIRDYKVQGRRVTKRTSNFTSVNSASAIPKEGKQSFKFRVIEPSPNFFVGVTNAFLRHNANIYSEHFIGLTFWGTIYTRGDCVPVVGRVRYEELPTVRITIDFQDNAIRWYSDEQLVGEVPLPNQLRFSELYFLFGMRDVDTAIQLLHEE